MIFTEAEGRERLLKSPLRHFTERFKLAETAAGATSLKLTDESNLESMLQASLTKPNEESKNE